MAKRNAQTEIASRSAPPAARACGWRLLAPLLFAVLALPAFLARVSAHDVARAAALTPAATQDTALIADADLGRSADGSVHSPLHDAASPACELTALEPPDVEETAVLDAAAVAIAHSFRPLARLASQVPHRAPVAWTSRALIAAALPRGPPARGC